ncbi:cdc42 effector protein 1b [Cololabis saira]|uniref:cdc42 effector protein 1b n=1 Tax=Cololabis saira TaxID=129043 RepID=UPI002AD44A33|nr:cdc42 effector protein 1b [Cololabis saira]
MSLGKLPGIKGLVSGNQGKRRFKSDLSVDMISPPLGDFRHTMHVGRGGDVFGDTSFLSNYGGLREPGSPDSSYSSKSTGFFNRTFRHVRRNSGSQHQEESRDLSSPPPDISPIIKNAISLPQLNIDATNGCLHRMVFPSSISSTDDSFCTYGVQSGFVTLPRISRLERHFQDGDICKASPPDNIPLTRSDSLASFTVDLGPSLMTEVLSLIDSSSSFQRSNHNQAAGEEEGGVEEDREEDSSLTDTPVQTPKMTSPTSSMFDLPVSHNMNSSGSPNWTQQEEDRSPRTPDASTVSPQRAEPVMEAERFQRATDVLARHYGGGSFTKATRMGNDTVSAAFCKNQKTPYAFTEDEEEIKV